MSTTREVRVIKATKGNDVANKIRVAAYCRVSSDSQDQANSFFAQVKYYNDYIRANEDMRLVDIYADEGITGTQADKREDFKRLVADVKKKKIDRVFVKSVTRFARNSLECIETVRVFKSCGASVYFENDRIDTERMNSEMILYIKSAFAQSEAENASRRMAVSNRMRMADGRYNLPKAPYGYRLSDDGLVVVPEEAENVRTIFHLYLSGMGYYLIAQYMQEHDPSIKWNYRRVQYILANEKYIGDCLLQKFYAPNTFPFTKKKNRGELPKYYYSDTHEPIVDKVLFYKVQSLRKEKEQKHYVPINKNKQFSFLHKKIYCRHCGWACKEKRRNDGTIYWTCRKQGLTKESCKAPPQKDEDVKAAFVKMFNTLKQNEREILHETLLQLQNLKMRANGGRDEIAEIDKEIVSLSEQIRIYTDLLAQQILDEIAYYEQTDGIKDRMTELRSRRLKILNDDKDENSIEQMRKTERIVKESAYITEFDESLFSEITERIYAEENGDLTFQLKCGLTLKVRSEERQ